MSQFDNRSLSIHAYAPLFSLGERLLIDDRLATRLSSYSHTIAALGGFMSATIDLSVQRSEADDWLDNGVGRHIEVFGNGPAAFEGFVNQIEITYGGGLSVRRGPLMDVGNKVKVVYQTETINTTPPIPGMRAETDYAEDTDSQIAFGILEIVLNGGTGTAALMEQKRDTYLAEYAWPESSSENISLPTEGGGLSVTLEVLGYRALLEHYVYNQTATNDSQDISDKIVAVLAAEPNSAFTAQEIATNSVQVNSYEDENNLAWAIIKECLNPGDASDNRYVFGVYENRQVYYQQIGASFLPDYQLRFSRAQSTLLDSAGQAVRPWDVRAGRWLSLPDLIPNKNLPYLATHQEPRLIFIESVTFTAPYRLEVTGSKVTRGRQRLTNLGLEGL